VSEPSSEPARGLYGLDNVRLELPIALAGSRSLAALVDYTILFILAAALFAGALLLAFTTGIFEGAAAGWVLALGLLALFLLEAGFFAIQELALGGQTLGKRMIGLRTVASRGGRAAPLALVLRNLLRSLDLLFGMWFLVFDPRGRRIGDRLAGTLVVHDRADGVEADAVFRVPAGWGPDRIRVVESLLASIGTLPDDRVEELSRRVLESAERDEPGFTWTGESRTSATTRLMVSFGRRGLELPAAETGRPEAAGDAGAI
jgi:uncharacterized RDD family membrane protein YckC